MNKGIRTYITSHKNYILNMLIMSLLIFIPSFFYEASINNSLLEKWLATITCIITILLSYYFLVQAIKESINRVISSKGGYVFEHLIYIYFISSIILILAFSIYNLIILDASVLKESKPINSIYFAVSTFTTLGFGDITPISSVGRMFTSFQAFMGTAHMVTFVSTVLASVTISNKKQ